MREIKFRGKHDGKWLHGYLDCNFKGAYTINEENKPYRMAVLNNRNYLGIEISKEYCDIANERIAQVDWRKSNEYQM